MGSNAAKRMAEFYGVPEEDIRVVWRWRAERREAGLAEDTAFLSHVVAEDEPPE